MPRQASKEWESTFAEEAVVGLENTERVGRVEDMVSLVAETFGGEKIVEARSGGAMILIREVDGEMRGRTE